MRKTNKIIIAVILISIMLLGIGYAAIQNITLNVTGTVIADPSQANFTVKFSGTPEVSDSTKVTAAITNDISATINVEGLTAKGDTVTAIYTVQNTSTDLSADLSVATTNSNEEYFVIDTELGKTSLIAGEATTLTVTVELIKTPIIADERSTIGIQLTAIPVQPGEEGTSGGSTGATGSTTSTVTSAGTYLPTGFTEVSGETEKTALTIADTSGNEYVWIEVPQTTEVYPTAGLAITEFTTEEYKAIEDDLHTYTATYRNSTNFVDEHPEETVEANTGLTSGEYTTLKQKMLKSVYQNGGFYVGKYETGIVDSYRDYELTEEQFFTEHPITETAVVQADAYPYNWVRCSQAQTLAGGMASGNYTSSLMFGVQWDLVLKYIEVKSVENGIELATIQSALTKDSTDYGNYSNSTYTLPSTSSAMYNGADETGEALVGWTSAASYTHNEGDVAILTTGASESFNLFGIYDLAGNMFEWTLEYTTYSSYPCALRGGVCDNYGSVYPASDRGDFNATFSDPVFGFRPSIF